MTDAANKPARRGRPRSVEAEQAILDSAYSLMASAGLEAATIDAIASDSGVSKMTIYKWWPSREALLIDAFLKKAESMFPLPKTGDPLALIRKHAMAYVDALNGNFGKVQLAVISDCIANTGSAKAFSERYLTLRREAGIRLIRAGQKTGTIPATEPAADLYDRIYGTLFYQYVFDLRTLTRDYAAKLVGSILVGR